MSYGYGPPDRRRPVDVKEALKASIFSNEGNPANDAHFGKNLPSPKSTWGISDQYVAFDSFRKNPDQSDPSKGRFQWNVMIQGTSHDSYTGVTGELGNVISVQVAPFIFPNVPEVPYVLNAAAGGSNQLSLVQNNTSATGVAPSLIPNASGVGQYPASALQPSATATWPWPANPYSQLTCGNRFTMQIVEPNMQAFSDGPGSRHHAEFLLENTTPFVSPNTFVASPIHGNHSETYNFTDPVIDFPSVTLVFRNPDEPIRFDPDVLYGAQSGVTAVGPASYISLTSPGHNLLSGDRIVIREFNSANAKLNAYMNRPEGHVAAGDPNSAPLAPGVPIVGNTFWTDPLVGIEQLVPVPTVNSVVNVCVMKRRLRVTLRFRTVVGRLTNYIHPTSV